MPDDMQSFTVWFH